MFARCLLFVVCCGLLDVCCVLCVRVNTRCWLFVVCCLLVVSVGCHLLLWCVVFVLLFSPLFVVIVVVCSKCGVVVR